MTNIITNMINLQLSIDGEEIDEKQLKGLEEAWNGFCAQLMQQYGKNISSIPEEVIIEAIQTCDDPKFLQRTVIGSMRRFVEFQHNLLREEKLVKKLEALIGQ